MATSARTWIVPLTCLGLALATGCSKKSSTGRLDGSDRDGGDADGPVAPPDCLTTADCTPPAICHPYALACVPPGASCTDHAECTDGRYCDAAAGSCLRGVTGSPCATHDNCLQSCTAGVCGCSGLTIEKQIGISALDIYMIFDSSISMGRDCPYTYGDTPSQTSKACRATYALANYLIDVEPEPPTRLALQFLPVQSNACSGEGYATAAIPLTELPVAADSELVTAVDDATFNLNVITNIEGALRGLMAFTAANATPGRQMIGVLMTDASTPLTCEDDFEILSTLIATNRTTPIFVIGMTGAVEASLDLLAEAGGAGEHTGACGTLPEPCHYWNVGDGSGDALAQALRAIVDEAVPIPCQLDVLDLTPPDGETLNFDDVNVNLTQGSTTTTLERVADETLCPSDRAAWYYDDAGSPTKILLCPSACTLVTDVGAGARVTVTVACQQYEDPV